MISLETAKALKEAGLKWEPKDGDLFLYLGEGLDEGWTLDMCNIFAVSGEHNLVERLGGRMVFFHGGLCTRTNSCVCRETHCGCMNKDGFNPDLAVDRVASWEKQIWLPRLDQLLAEIEKTWSDDEHWWAMEQKNLCLFRIGPDCWREVGHMVYADTPEEAAAKSLLWIYQQKEGEK